MEDRDSLCALASVRKRNGMTLLISVAPLLAPGQRCGLDILLEDKADKLSSGESS
jgi:hypothetical protein